MDIRTLLNIVISVRLNFSFVRSYYGLPLHLVRDLYDTFRTFKQRVADFMRYRRLTSNMNDRFVDATPEELSRYSLKIGSETMIMSRKSVNIVLQRLPEDRT